MNRGTTSQSNRNDPALQKPPPGKNQNPTRQRSNGSPILLLLRSTFLGVRIPGAYLLAHPACLNLGVEGAWYAMLADVSVRCLLVCWRFARGRWKKIEV